MVDFTVVCPIHDEAKLLRKTIDSQYAVKPAAVYFLLDDCTDSSLDLVVAASGRYPRVETIIDRVSPEEGTDYAFRPAYLRRRAYDRCTTRFILNSAADLKLDPAIGKHIAELEHYALLSFGFYEMNIQGIARAVFHAIEDTHFGGVTAFDKRHLALEDRDHLKTIPAHEDKHLIDAIDKHLSTRHILTSTLHLRPRPHNWGRFVNWDTKTI